MAQKLAANQDNLLFLSLFSISYEFINFEFFRSVTAHPFLWIHKAPFCESFITPTSAAMNKSSCCP
jgi:hypothetical protein